MFSICRPPCICYCENCGNKFLTDTVPSYDYTISFFKSFAKKKLVFETEVPFRKCKWNLNWPFRPSAKCPKCGGTYLSFWSAAD